MRTPIAEPVTDPAGQPSGRAICTEQHLRLASGSFPTGVTVTTALSTDGAPLGLTINSFTSVSLDPPLILVCINQKSRMIEHLAIGRPFAVNVLSEAQRELSIRFSSPISERFDGIQWYSGESGAPLLHDVAAVLECETAETIGSGDHRIIIGRVLRAFSSGLFPLIYFQRTYKESALAHSITLDPWSCL